MTVADIVSELENAGVALQLQGEKVRVWYPDGERRRELAAQIAFLRTQRVEVAAYLKARSAIPLMPKGVRLIRWEPKSAPVAIDVCSVVVNVPKSIGAELSDLDSRLNHPWTIRGGWTVTQIIGRLAQAGVKVELELIERRFV